MITKKETHYKIFDTKTQKFLGAGLSRYAGNGKTWTSLKNLKLALNGYGARQVLKRNHNLIIIEYDVETKINEVNKYEVSHILNEIVNKKRQREAELRKLENERREKEEFDLFKKLKEKFEGQPKSKGFRAEEISGPGSYN